MRGIHELLDEYGLSHQNTINKRLHWVCVPAIVFSLLGVLWLAPVPYWVAGWINWAAMVVSAAMIYYVVVAPRMLLGVAVYVALNVAGIVALENTDLPLLHVHVAIFVIAWVGQFVGHAIEGRRPSFFQDVQFLLIGPLWLLAFIYRRRNWRY